jgi:hypothetical protein
VFEAYLTSHFFTLSIVDGRIGEVSHSGAIPWQKADMLIALNGSKHLEFLLDHNLIKPTSMADLEHVYSKHPENDSEKPRIEEFKDEKHEHEDTMLLTQSDGKDLAKVLHAPELAAEVERAVEQVEKSHESSKKGR